MVRFSSRRPVWVVLGASLLVAGSVAEGARAGRRGALPDAVLNAVKEAFPQATIISYGRERESGVMYYEVNLRHNGNRIEVEVAPDGSIGEVEGVVDMADVPKSVAEEIRRVVGGGKILRVELHERRGVARGGRFVPLQKPRIFYEAKYYSRGRRREFSVPYSRSVPLPDKAAKSLAALFPRAKVTEGEEKTVDGATFYEATFIERARQVTVLVSPDGVVVMIRRDAAPASLPKPVAQAIRTAAPGATIGRVEHVEVRAVVTDGRPVPLEAPMLGYHALVFSKGRKADLAIAPDGTLAEKPKWEDLHDEDDEDDDDED